jgi:hypothetical protein
MRRRCYTEAPPLFPRCTTVDRSYIGRTTVCGNGVTVELRYHFGGASVNTSAVLRYHIGTSTVHIEATGELPIHYGRYRSSTAINEAIPEYCRCSPIARSGSATADMFKHVKNVYRRLPLLHFSPIF